MAKPTTGPGGLGNGNGGPGPSPGTSGNGSSDAILGGAGNDSLFAGSQGDWLYGAGGNDSLFGGSGNDVVEGGEGNDILTGNTGRDIGYGGLGEDSLAGGNQEDQLFGGEGNDTLDGGQDQDFLDGGANNDLLFGGAAADTVLGGEGSDSLYGGDGADWIDGGAGADYLTGGTGSDTFRGGIGDTIDGAEDGSETDVLDLTGIGPYRLIRDPLNPENGTVEFLDADGNVLGTMSYTNIETVVMCFTPGTRIATTKGERAIETLEAGDLVLTRDNGAQPVRWLGRRRLSGMDLALDPTLQPIRIRQGALGHGLPERDMMVSRQHRMLVTGPRADLLFGSDEVLVRAQHLTCLPGVQAVKLPEVTYLHLLFDRHEVVMANGAWSESFQPGERTLGGMEDAARDELFRIFPELRDAAGLFPAARVTLKGFEARVLLAA